MGKRQYAAHQTLIIPEMVAELQLTGLYFPPLPEPTNCPSHRLGIAKRPSEAKPEEIPVTTHENEIPKVDDSTSTVVVPRTELNDLIALCNKLAEVVVAHAPPQMLAAVQNEIGLLGEKRFCCHYYNSNFPNTRFCTPHTSYHVQTAKIWCRLQASGDTNYDHIQEDKCSTDGGDACDAITE